MEHHLRIIPAHILMYTFICSFAALPMAAPAMDHTPPSYDSEHSQDSHNAIQNPHVEGHIAFLHAELGITPAQEPYWTPVATAMREDVKNMQEAESRVASQTRGPETAIQYLENRTMFANLRAEGEARFLKAFSPLYDRLSDAQKETADELMESRPD